MRKRASRFVLPDDPLQQEIRRWVEEFKHGHPVGSVYRQLISAAREHHLTSEELGERLHKERMVSSRVSEIVGILSEVEIAKEFAASKKYSLRQAIFDSRRARQLRKISPPEGKTKPPTGESEPTAADSAKVSAKTAVDTAATEEATKKNKILRTPGKQVADALERLISIMGREEVEKHRKGRRRISNEGWPVDCGICLITFSANVPTEASPINSPETLAFVSPIAGAT